MKNVSLFCIGSLVFITLIAGCKKDQPTQPVQEGFTGILATDGNCDIIGGDTTDFLPRPTVLATFPHSPTNYSLSKACPNPVIGDTTNIYFQISVADSVLIRVFATTNAAPVATLLNERFGAGIYYYRWGFNGPNGIYRIQMSTGSGFTSYGDVEFR